MNPNKSNLFLRRIRKKNSKEFKSLSAPEIKKGLTDCISFCIIDKQSEILQTKYRGVEQLGSSSGS